VDFSRDCEIFIHPDSTEYSITLVDTNLILLLQYRTHQTSCRILHKHPKEAIQAEKGAIKEAAKTEEATTKEVAVGSWSRKRPKERE
jgi:hypothetical protein